AANSPAMDASDASVAGATDQRGAERGPAGLNAGKAPDIGAFEATSSYLVTSSADDLSVGTLRTAITWETASVANNNPANAGTNAAPNTIRFGVNPLVINVTTDSTLQALVAAVNALPAQRAPVTIELKLAPGLYHDISTYVPPGVTLIINGDGKSETIVGQS